LGHALAGLATARTEPDQITLFNSVGLALQDLAFAALVTGHADPPAHPKTATGHLTFSAPDVCGASAAMIAGRH
jgi:Ornithine cyclodeaminase/mu-crystallin family